MADSNVNTDSGLFDARSLLTMKANQLDVLIGDIWGRKDDEDIKAGFSSDQGTLLRLASDLAGEVLTLARERLESDFAAGRLSR